MSQTDLDLATRIDRLESIEAIRALVVRYAHSVDSRDLDAMVALYTDDTPVTPGVRGRAALREALVPILGTRFTTTVHFVGNHLVELDTEDANRASGYVYCRAEHEVDDKWVIVMMQYNDKYRRDNSVWHFYSRRVRTWYAVDLLDRPTGPDKVRFIMSGEQARPADLPSSWPTWEHFWNEEVPQP